MTLALPDCPRFLIEVDLKPVQGSRFQPTGFPDVGAGRFELPDKTPMLLVESHQSVANRLEAVCWDEAAEDLHPTLKGLPFVKIDVGDGKWTSSVLEAHRLNSPYIEKSDVFPTIKQEIGFVEKRPMDRQKLLTTLLRRDPGCLLHGVFLESIAGVLRIPRALSGFIEASSIGVVQTGGVKNDRVAAGKDAEGGATAKDGFGNVPFHRDEFVAERITAYFNIDLEQIRGYGLGKDVEALLFALSVWKIRSFLDRGLRLRTACDLEPSGEIKVTRPAKGTLPALEDAASAIAKLIKVVDSEGKFAKPPVTIGKFGGTGKAKKV